MTHTIKAGRGAQSPVRGRNAGGRTGVLLLVWLNWLVWNPFCGAVTPPKSVRQFIHRSWQAEADISVISISSLAQTQDGYLWIGSSDGLARFDGHRFIVFRKKQQPGLLDDSFRTLLVANDQSLYGGTDEGGLVRLRNGVFKTFTKRDGLAEPNVRALAESRDGAIYIGTMGGGVYVLRGEKITSLPLPSDAGVDVTALWCGENGELWIGYRLDGLLGRWTPQGYETRRLPGADHETQVRSIVPGPNGSLYIATLRNGLFQLSYGGASEPEKLECPGEIGGGSAMTFDADGALWVALETGGVARQKDGIWSQLSLGEGLTSPAATSILRDAEGNIWTGTLSGLDRFYPGPVTTYGKPEGLVSDYVTCVTEDREGRLWVGTLNDGVSVMTPDGFTAFNPGTAARRKVRCLAPAKSGGLWIGTTGGLGRLQEGVFRFYDARDGVPPGAVLSVFEDAETNLWVGVGEGAGLLTMSPDGLVKRHPGTEKLSIRAIVPDRKGGLWLGTQTAGLLHFKNGVDGAWSKDEGLSDDSVRCVLVDSHDRVWVGTRDGGISRMAGGRVSGLNRNEGFIADLVSGLVEDDDQHLWMSSSRGIIRASQRGLERMMAGDVSGAFLRRFGEADGMRHSECVREHSPAAFRGQDGRMWFATPMGLSMVDPRTIKVVEESPRVKIEAMVFDGREQDLDREFVFPPGAGNVRIEFTAPALRHPGKVRFQYRLTGIDDDWKTLPPMRREISYVNLKPREYQFSVRAAVGEGAFSGSPAVVAFTLRPHFYQTGVFLWSLVAGAAVAILALHRRRLRTIARRAATLSAEVESRTAELRLEIAERRRAEDQLRLLPSRILQAQESERRRVASELHDSVNQLLASIRFRVHYIESLALENPLLRKTTIKTKELLENAVQEVRRISRNLRPNELDDFGLKAALDNAGTEFRERTGLRLDISYEDLPERLPQNIELPAYRIVQEALTNVERHAQATAVQVRLSGDGEFLKLTIHDNGRGFAPVSEPGLRPAKGGIGLLNIQERAAAAGGLCVIQSTPGRGTEIQVTLPCPLPTPHVATA